MLRILTIRSRVARGSRAIALAAALASLSIAAPALGQDVDAAGQRYAGTVRHCYEEGGLKADPTLGGLLRVSLTVLPAGDVGAATVTPTRVRGIGMPAVVRCVSTAARSWRVLGGSRHPRRVVLWFDLLPPARLEPGWPAGLPPR